MEGAISTYLALLKARSRSPSRHGQASHLFERLLLHLRDNCSVRTWSDVTSHHLVDFALAEARLKNRRGRSVSAETYRLRISILRAFFAWLLQSGRILANPSDVLTLPKAPGRLPPVPSAIEIARLIETPDTGTAVGLRDRALMETLYATGLRHWEAWNLDLYDIDLETGRLTVRQGKGGHDRVVPLTENACRWLALYVQNGRSRAGQGRRLRDPGPGPAGGSGRAAPGGIGGCGLEKQRLREKAPRGQLVDLVAKSSTLRRGCEAFATRFKARRINRMTHTCGLGPSY
jgi:site-specific recombinase XerD